MSVESEQAVVAAAVTSAAQYDAVSQIVSSADFTDDKMRVIWDGTSALREAGRTVDIVTLSAFLDRSTRWQSLQAGEAIGYIDALIDAAHAFQASVVYADIVKQASMNRQLLAYSESVKELAHVGDLEADAKLGEAYSLLSQLTKNTPDGFATYKEAAREAVGDILALIERGDGLSGLPTGFKTLDDITAGLQNSNLIYIGARPSMGKTIMGMNIANHIAKTDPVLVFSLEMAKQDIAKRSLSDFSGIHMTDVMRGNIDLQKKPKLTAAGIELSRLNLRIDDSAGLHVDQLRTRARIASRKEMPRLIVIDYLTLIKGKGDTSHQEVGYVSKSLKQMAKELQCPVVCLAQLNRGLENRPDRRPKLSDLRESGSIEEDADVVMFLYRDEVYDENSDRKGILEVNIAKNRNGPIGTRFLKSELEFQRFRELTTAVPPITQKKNNRPLASVLSGTSTPNAAINDAEGF